MHYLLMYDTADDYLTARAPYRKRHLLHAIAAHQRGELVLGGALANPATSSPALLPQGEGSVVWSASADEASRLGAVILFQGDSPKAAEDFAKADPYVLNGVIKSWRVREWTTVVGEHASVRVDPNSL